MSGKPITRLFLIWLATGQRNLRNGLVSVATLSLASGDVFISCFSGGLTFEICCGDPPTFDCFPEDGLIFMRDECCGTGYTLVDPMAGLPAPTEDVSDTMQSRWEAFVASSSLTVVCSVQILQKLVTLTMRTFKLMRQDGCRLLEEDPYAIVGNFLSDKEHFGNGDATIIDVGANIGLVTVLLAKLYPFARIIAVEPNPVAFRYLLWNLRANGAAENVEALPMAIWNSSGRTRHIAVCPPFQALGTWVCDTQRALTRRMSRLSHAERSVSVRTISLPALLQQKHVGAVGLLKMDCEGCEHAVRVSSDWPSLRAHVFRWAGEFHGGGNLTADFRSASEFNKLWGDFLAHERVSSNT